MYPEALGVALRVAKHLGTILTSLETAWDNLKKIEKNRFFSSIFLKSLAVLSFASGNFLTGGFFFLFHFLRSKNDFFKVLQTFRGWFLSGLDGLRGVLSTLKPFYHTTH